MSGCTILRRGFSLGTASGWQVECRQCGDWSDARSAEHAAQLAAEHAAWHQWYDELTAAERHRLRGTAVD
jgi:hypothetical protein